jgi:DNA helicase HerA-like ATPase
MPDFIAGKVEHVRELCQKLKPIFGEKMQQLFAAYCAEDDEGKKQIESYLEVLAAKHLFSGVDSIASLIPPTKEQADGGYPIGTVLYNNRPLYPFGLRENEWIQHVGIFGRSGAGKTNVGFLLLRELKRKGKPVLVFDWKRNYRDLLGQPEFQDMEVYTIGRNIAPFTFNPLIPPPGTNPKTWLKKLIGVIATSYLLGNGSLYVLQESLDSVYQEAGIYSGKISYYPTFRDVIQKVRQFNAKGREAGWLSSTLRALSSICFGEMDTLVNAGRNENLEHLLTKSVILELDALTQADKVFVTSALLLWIHHRRMVEKTRETLKGIVLVEEAHQILANERGSLLGGQSIMEITFREIREFGEGLIILDQHPSQISLPALGNTYCTICMNLKHQKDISAMSQCMLLDGKEADLLGELEVGQAIVKLQGRIPRAFMIELPEFEIKKGAVTDEKVRDRMWPVLQARMKSEETPAEWAEVAGEEELEGGGELQTPRGEVEPDLEQLFLQDVREYPDSGIGERYHRLGISVRQGQRLKAQLVEKGLIEEAEKKTKTGRLRVIRLTGEGERRLS